MKKISSKYACLYHMAIAACLATNLSSCSDNTGTDILNAEQDELLTRSIQLSVPLDAKDADSLDVQIFIYDQTGTKFLGEAETTAIDLQADSTYLAHAIIEADNAAITASYLRCKLIVLGNAPDTDGSISSIERLKFDHTVSSLPLYGAVNVEQQLDPKLEVSCAEIPLLRSGALLKVQLGQDLYDAGITLGSVVIKGVNKNGFVAPKNAMTFNSLTDIDPVKFFNPDASQKTDLTLTQMPDSSMQSYVPECEAPADGPFEIDLQFLRDGKPYTGIFGQKIYLKDYATNKPLDIVRGNQYIFTIRSLQTEADLEIKVENWKHVTPENVVFK